MSLSNLSVSRKLAAGFACVLVAVAIMCAALFGVLSSLDAAARLNTDTNNVTYEVDRIIGALFDQSSSSRGYISTQAEQASKAYDDAVKYYEQNVAAVRKDATTHPEILTLINKLVAAADLWRQEIGEPQMRLARNPQTLDQAAQLAKSPRGRELMKPVRELVNETRGKIDAWSADAQGKQDRLMSFAQLALILGGLSALILSLLVGWWLSRTIATPVREMTGAMKKLAEGDDRVAVPALGRRDEIGRMAEAVQVFKDAAVEKTRLEAQAETTRRQAEEARAAHEAEKAEEARQLQFATDALGEGMEHLASGDLAIRLETPFQAKVDKLRLDFNRSVEKLQHTMLTIASSTKGIGSGTEEISRAADDMSRRTEQQAASLEETAAALDEITATVKKTAEGAAHAREVVSNAKTDAEKSGAVVREAIKAMGGIEKSSQQIGQIIGVIDEIAFQTNLLALNAGVEAARAGDAGRGFAVVASEVRALAQRSAEAAKEIKALISTSSTQVEQGVDLVGKAGQALERIATQIAEMNTVIADIAVGAREQATGLQQVNTAINQMDQGTQQSAAMAEESTAATHSLAQESDELVQLVSQFQLGAGATSKGATKVEPMRARVANSSSAKPSSVRPSSAKPQPALKTMAGRRGETAVRKAEAAPDADGWEEF
ncbi:methyl-accepting chemotaxis protein [Rhizobiales bacterium GAS191]|nr:methyl-accepting chemotaxis protein [Rhizobiales bacterium GAS191]